MKAAKVVAPYLFVLACIVVFVPLPVWSANTIGFLALVNAHRDQGTWTLKFEPRRGRFFIVDFMSDSRAFSSAERLAQKIIDAWMERDLDPYAQDVTLIVTTTRLRKKGSPTERDVYVPTDAIAYNSAIDAYENAMALFRNARDENPGYLWGIVSPGDAASYARPGVSQ